MNENAESLIMATQQLRSMFATSHELKGFDDWDKFIGCIVMIENVANSLKAETKEKTSDDQIK